MDGLESYDFGRKRKWRRELWNNISKRLMVPRGDAVVLYLPGPEDEDRKIAIQKGFKSRNLIAVDVNYQYIKKVREEGGIGLCDNLNSVLKAWGRGPISAVVADFCCGFNDTVGEFIQGLSCTVAHVVAINMQRGRDPESNWIRRVKGDLDFIKDKHRGRQFMAFYLAKLTIQISEINAQMINCRNDLHSQFIKKVKSESEVLKEGRRIFTEISPTLEKYTDAKFLSYKSCVGNLYMDSVIFRRVPFLITNENANPGTKRKIAAARALRTMQRR